MAEVSDKMAKSFETEDTSGVLSWLLAEEDELDRRALWRLGSWAVASAGAVILAVLANQSSMGMRREHAASTDLARQSQLIEQVARDTQNEARRLASAVETLNGDRDRLYSRVAVLEHGLDSVTGTTSRQNTAATSPQIGTPASSATQASTGQPSPSQGPPSQGPPTQGSPAQGSPRETSSGQGSIAAAAIAPVSANAAATASAASPTIPAPAATTATSSTEAPAAAQKTSAAPAAPVAASAPATPEKPPIVASGADPRVAPASPAASSASAPVLTPAASSLVSKSVLAPPDPAAPKMVEPAPAKVITAAPLPDVVASSSPSEDVKEQESAAPALAVQRTEFGVDVGGANSIPGLRALWRGLLKWRSNGPLTALRPIIVIKENQNGLGMQLRLVAGPISDAAAAAKTCAAMIANERPCTTAVFEGQRLVMNADEAPPAPGVETKPGSEARAFAPRRYTAKRANPKEETAPKTDPSTVSSIFGHTNR
jgi:hypothetical protein